MDLLSEIGSIARRAKPGSNERPPLLVQSEDQFEGGCVADYTTSAELATLLGHVRAAASVADPAPVA